MVRLSADEVLFGIWVVFSSLFLAIFAEVGIVMLRLQGEHVVAGGDIILLPSLYDTVRAMQNVQSISQFATETAVGLVCVLAMTLGAAAYLLAVSLWPPQKRSVIWGNLLGYFIVIFVGIFPCSVPGAPPRRNYNPVLLWTLPDATTAPIHITASALFLYLPLVSTVWFLLRNRKALRDWHVNRWLALYGLLFIISGGYGIADLAADSNTTLTPGTWLLLELTAFGCSFAVFSFFELVRLREDVRGGYSRL